MLILKASSEDANSKLQARIHGGSARIKILKNISEVNKQSIVSSFFIVGSLIDNYYIFNLFNCHFVLERR